jgi:hypothetical protein
MLGALQVSAAILPRFNAVQVEQVDGKKALAVPIMGYKNNLYSEGNIIRLFKSSNKCLCPVATWKRWKRSTTTIRSRTRDPRIVFELERPHDQLSPGKCATILKGIARTAGLDTAVFTARTFRKSGVMAGINAGVDADAIFRLGGWRDPATFHRHYVMTEIPNTYTDILFDLDEQEDVSENDQSDSDTPDDEHDDVFDLIQ